MLKGISNAEDEESTEDYRGADVLGFTPSLALSLRGRGFMGVILGLQFVALRHFQGVKWRVVAAGE